MCCITVCTGDYTLVNIPWAGRTTLQFNDTAAATLSTLGNAALLVGGLYLLSGFPAAALADPFGISRRLGAPAPASDPAPPPAFHGHHAKLPRKKKNHLNKRRPLERRGEKPRSK